MWLVSTAGSRTDRLRLLLTASNSLYRSSTYLIQPSSVSARVSSCLQRNKRRPWIAYTLFLQSDAAATILFAERFCAATIRGRLLFKKNFFIITFKIIKKKKKKKEKERSSCPRIVAAQKRSANKIVAAASDWRNTVYAARYIRACMQHGFWRNPDRFSDKLCT